ncbi:hypothetical protein [Paenibacillus silvae]|uniref:hypothetical protein n=1 Tax=Paenibacillus silvae TaxID=1325358 RepID=UPI001642F880|nr:MULTISPECIES: hypothetical protein [Paenibacillus]MCK6075011.1 hypothetical protein [Paenibacillus silvae]MCK6149398.1 hypothetical protein [Paenibacillus silvae]MCK6267697.1 hypothetical protein [Paenibacillus silvae]
MSPFHVHFPLTCTAIKPMIYGNTVYERLYLLYWNEQEYHGWREWMNEKID